MAKENVLVKISGNLIENNSVISWLQQLAEKFHVVICTGGGTQINEAFEKHGFEIKFGPYGRETASFEERQIARDVLEINQLQIQDLLQEKNINAEVVIPVRNIGSVLCHINGDLFVLEGLLGFDRACVLTELGNVDNKKIFYQQYPKIEVIGF